VNAIIVIPLFTLILKITNLYATLVKLDFVQILLKFCPNSSKIMSKFCIKQVKNTGRFQKNIFIS